MNTYYHLYDQDGNRVDNPNKEISDIDVAVSMASSVVKDEALKGFESTITIMKAERRISLRKLKPEEMPINSQAFED